ncbi:hypothetical protein VYU27_009927 [Nannochloropsis oceanica]
MELVLCSLWLSRRYFGGGREQGRQGGGHKTVDWKGLLKGVHEGGLSTEAVRGRLAIELDAAYMVWDAERRRLERQWKKINAKAQRLIPSPLSDDGHDGKKEAPGVHKQSATKGLVVGNGRSSMLPLLPLAERGHDDEETEPRDSNSSSSSSSSSLSRTTTRRRRRRGEEGGVLHEEEEEEDDQGEVYWKERLRVALFSFHRDGNALLETKLAHIAEAAAFKGRLHHILPPPGAAPTAAVAVAEAAAAAVRQTPFSTAAEAAAAAAAAAAADGASSIFLLLDTHPLLLSSPLSSLPSSSSSSSLTAEALITAGEETFASLFCNGNRETARLLLFSHQGMTTTTSSNSSSSNNSSLPLRLGALLVLLAWCLWDCLFDDSLGKSIFHDPSFKIFRGLSNVILLLWGLGVVLFVINAAGIDYR